MTAAPPDKARRIYLLRSLLAPLVSYRWTKLIQGVHHDLGAPAPVERILSKVVRSYLRRGLRPRARLSILRGHYDWVRATFSDETLRKIASNEPIEIAAIEARKNSRYRVDLAWSLVAFVLVHVFMVLVSGVWNHLRSLVTGRYAIREARGAAD